MTLEDGGLVYIERKGLVRPLDTEKIGSLFWVPFVALVQKMISDGYMTQAFPLVGYRVVDYENLLATLRALVDRRVDIQPAMTPETYDILNIVEFFAERVSKPTFDDGTLEFDREIALEEYRFQVNRLLRRCSHPYSIDSTGRVMDVGAPILGDVVRQATFNSGDPELDNLLDMAVERFTDPDSAMRVDALEKLWDAWERLKTLLSPDKAQGITDLLEQAVQEDNLRARCGQEAKELTDIGNKFRIRHHEANRVKVAEGADGEYLFHRLFALIYFLLSATGRATR